MPIAFEGVSFSYDEPVRPSRAERRRQKRAAREAAKENGTAGAGAPMPGAEGATSGTATPPDAAAPGVPGAAVPAAPGRAWALRDITFSLEAGELFGVAGHTGSGKSTLIQHMNGLLHPTQGSVRAWGRDLADAKAAQECRGRIGLVFQYPEHQLFAATVSEDVAFGPRNLGCSETEADARVRTALAQVNLDADDIGGMSPFELSGGQQRRVALAGVLAMEPEVLVLDEPVAGLDPVGREEFLQLIGRLHAGGLTIVLVSHHMDDLARLCGRILVLCEGGQFALGTPEEVFSQAEELRRIGLDVPAAQRVALALRAQGISLDRRLYDADSLAGDLARLYREGRG